jgi:ubiquinone/menaquinone biosynthesis C-methylase UbiE
MDGSDKHILDACCGSRMFWFDKNNSDVLFVDIRNESHTLCDGRDLQIKPDMISDFTRMDFNDDSFHMVVFDPPHLENLGKNSWMAKKYGVLSYTWKDDIKLGLTECMRILRPYGTLIFKWNESRIKVSEILELIPFKPLFGHTSGRQSKTIWMAFMKLPL